MSRAVLALLVVALGLGLYLWLVEIPAERKRVEAETTAKKLVDFKEDDVQGFTIISSRGEMEVAREDGRWTIRDRKSTRLNSSHGYISYAVFCLKKKKREHSVRIERSTQSANMNAAT